MSCTRCSSGKCIADSPNLLVISLGAESEFLTAGRIQLLGIFSHLSGFLNCEFLLDIFALNKNSDAPLLPIDPRISLWFFPIVLNSEQLKI